MKAACKGYGAARRALSKEQGAASGGGDFRMQIGDCRLQIGLSAKWEDDILRVISANASLRRIHETPSSRRTHPRPASLCSLSPPPPTRDPKLSKGWKGNKSPGGRVGFSMCSVVSVAITTLCSRRSPIYRPGHEDGGRGTPSCCPSPPLPSPLSPPPHTAWLPPTAYCHDLRPLSPRIPHHVPHVYHQ